ncbi:hypothetical protein IMG5_193540 [Ichthyophthirius multifiliis]|uniref:Serine-threonine kinase receptor-associated protein n=1 Tax=Ichthyophthirius multifiliis TaxID=5932 RepID=G0R4K3_ICHMU|nr:hypothetical protein IMG5_193540 [Ichthyophthirius multifiliis]EGR27601.1 hypothetical protein IMG5_193540 [Ichthyophthirius multifiliis]|eukprot:XP_004025053.1 hypothetical protein IMG5_193540 [Ichthyophthirius multifiliis]
MKAIELRGHEKPISVIKFNFDGDLFFTGAAEKKVNVWRNHTYERIGSFKTNSSVKILDITIDSKYLVTGSLEGTIQVFEVNGGKSIGSYKTKYKCKHLEFSYGNKHLMVLFEDYGSTAANQVGIYDFQFFLKHLIDNNGEPKDDSIPTVCKFSLKEHIANKIRYSYLNKYFYATTTEGLLLKFSDKGELIQKIQAHQGEALAIEFAKDFSIMSTTGSDGCRFWDMDGLKCLRFIKQQVQMNTVAISPLLTGEFEQVKYHCLIGGGLPARDTARFKVILCIYIYILFLKDGGYEIHLCNIMYGEELGSISGHFGPINQIVFQPDGRGFISGGEESIVRCFRFDGSYWENEALE